MLPTFRRGLLVGLIAGLVTGAFHYWVSEPFIQQALRFEVLPPGEQSVEVFTRETQRAGLVAATALYGLSLGGIFGVIYPFIAKRFRSGTSWDIPIRVTVAGFACLWLVPFLKYPANPPAVGDPETINVRTALYLTMIAVSIASALLAWTASRRLSERGTQRHTRHLLVAGGYGAVVVAAYVLLPSNPDPITIPAKLLWNFRLASVAGQGLFWTVLGVGFALLSLRAEREPVAIGTSEPKLATARG
jgi:predicted cobalt transporter CbtA